MYFPVAPESIVVQEVERGRDMNTERERGGDRAKLVFLRLNAVLTLINPAKAYSLSSSVKM